MTGRSISHYRIVAKLGEGGMGEVWKAEDLELGRFVALKALPSASVPDEARRTRFLREARATSALNHPNIVTVYDIVHDGDSPFLVMEFVDGRTLDHLIHGHGLPLPEALRVAIPIADALATAHKTGLIHRDLKPGNIMIRQDGTVKVLDFGLVKLLEERVMDETKATIAEGTTQQGVVLGTVAYMSPEQAQGKPVDARSDIFSFGVLLYELVTGRRAFALDNKASTLVAVVGADPKAPSEIVPNLPREMERLIQRCLRKDPSKRWQTMADLKVALEELKEESDSGRLTAAQSASPPRASRLLFTGVVVSLLSAIVVLSVLLWPKPSHPSEQRPRRVVLTTYPGAETDPSLSPDGKSVAFIWDGEDQKSKDVYVKLVDAGGPLRLTRTPEPEGLPKWSPDGTQIAFLRKQAVYSIPALGGAERRLIEPPVAAYDWSPAGDAMVVASQDVLQRVDLATGRKTALTSSKGGSVDSMPAWSPSGDRIAFVRAQSQHGQMNILVMPAAGGEPREVVVQQGFNHWPVWSGDERSLIFLRQWSALQRAPLSGGVVERVPDSDDFAGRASISWKARRLVYSRQDYDLNIWGALLGSSSKAEVLVASTQRDFCPQISPNGQRLAFTSDRSGSWELWLSDQEGRNQTQLTTFGNAIVDGAAWSPDNAEIVFSALIAGNRDLYAVNVDSAATRRLTSEPSDEGRPAFSRDGNTIFFRSDRSGHAEIWRMPRTGGAAEQMTADGGFDVQPSWDGASIYFSKSRYQLGLWTMPAHGGSASAVPGLEHVAPGHWAVSSVGIHWLDKSTNFQAVDAGATLIASDSAGALVHWNPLTGTNTPVLTVTAPIWPVARSLSVSADGRRAYWHQSDGTGADLVLFENFR